MGNISYCRIDPRLDSQISELGRLLELSRRKVDAMSPRARSEMLAQQGRNYAVSEAGFGSDADEAAYREALASGDGATLRRIDAESAERMRRARAVLDKAAGIATAAPLGDEPAQADGRGG